MRSASWRSRIFELWLPADMGLDARKSENLYRFMKTFTASTDPLGRTLQKSGANLDEKAV
jgi:hypothetical protein